MSGDRPLAEEQRGGDLAVRLAPARRAPPPRARAGSGRRSACLAARRGVSGRSGGNMARAAARNARAARRRRWTPPARRRPPAPPRTRAGLLGPLAALVNLPERAVDLPEERAHTALHRAALRILQHLLRLLQPPQARQASPRSLRSAGIGCGAARRARRRAIRPRSAVPRRIPAPQHQFTPRPGQSAVRQVPGRATGRSAAGSAAVERRLRAEISRLRMQANTRAAALMPIHHAEPTSRASASAASWCSIAGRAPTVGRAISRWPSARPPPLLMPDLGGDAAGFLCPGQRRAEVAEWAQVGPAPMPTKACPAGHPSRAHEPRRLVGVAEAIAAGPEGGDGRLG